MGRWLVFAGTLVVALTFIGVGHAHGREVNIGVSCLTPDPARPLSKVCTAVVAYLDGDPVGDAKLNLSASREDGDQHAFGPVPLQLASEAGVYTASFDYPAYGTWAVTVKVMDPGEGEAHLRDEVLPPLPGTIGSLASTARVRIVLNFDARELTNILMRVLHLASAAAWFGASALILAPSLFLSGSERDRVTRSLAGLFPWVSGASFLVLALTGWYNAVYNVPARPPGLFDPELISRLPFGLAYLMAFLAKMALTGAALVGSGALAVALRRAYAQTLRPIAGGAVTTALPSRRVEPWVIGLSVTNVSLGLLVFVDVVVLGYLHILTHIGGITGAR